MKKAIMLILCLSLALPLYATDDHTMVKQMMSAMPLAFTQNNGQWPDSILFSANAGGAIMWFAKAGTYYQFALRVRHSYEPSIQVFTKSDRVINSPQAGGFNSTDDGSEILMIKTSLINANSNPQVIGLDQIEYKCNYFLGNETSKWRTDVPNYRAIKFEDVYPGIDLKYYGDGRLMEYDFVVSPGADYSQIEMRYDGAESLAVNSSGELVIATKYGLVTERRPVVYQAHAGTRSELNGRYVLLEGNRFCFKLDSGYDPKLPIVIDPVLVYSTFLGGSYEERGFGIAVDAAGCAYVTGATESANFPTLNAYHSTYGGGGYDAFVTKFAPGGNSLIYSTYLGGSGFDYAYGIAVDMVGNAYVTGGAGSVDFPTMNAIDSTLDGNSDAFVAKLAPGGDSLVYSTYLGGSMMEDARKIAVDASENAYIVGTTVSTDFPTLNAYDNTSNGNGDVFATKLATNGDSLIYSTYLGGNSNEGGYGIAVDTTGSAFVVGVTESAEFPTHNAYDSTFNGGYDAFVTKLAPEGNSLVYSTFLGGDMNEGFPSIALDAAGSPYVAGSTESLDFPTVNAYDSTFNGGYDAFVTTFAPGGNSLVYSTLIGGGSYDDVFGVAVDTNGNAYIAGGTESADYPTWDAIDNTFNGGNVDILVTELTPNGESLIYSTYLGGNSFECGYGIAVDAAGSAFVVGITESTDFPTLDGFDSTWGGVQDAFVVKIAKTPVPVEEIFTPQLPTEFILLQNCPNPFNPSTIIQYSIARKCQVALSIYNVIGQKVRTLIDETKSAGSYRIEWNGNDDSGKPVSTGVYLYRFQAGDVVQTRKMLLLK